jgi:hypothetical protein
MLGLLSIILGSGRFESEIPSSLFEIIKENRFLIAQRLHADQIFVQLYAQLANVLHYGAFVVLTLCANGPFADIPVTTRSSPFYFRFETNAERSHIDYCADCVFYLTPLVNTDLWLQFVTVLVLSNVLCHTTEFWVSIHEYCHAAH